eukprot:15478334-Alexandrium_andersonii.AAC.1
MFENHNSKTPVPQFKTPVNMDRRTLFSIGAALAFAVPCRCRAGAVPAPSRRRPACFASCFHEF